MTHTENLSRALGDLNTSGLREFYLVDKNDVVQEYGSERNQLMAAMSQEIDAAVETIKAGYQQKITTLENEYAIYLSMITPARGSE